MLADDVSKWEHVEGEKGGAEKGSLGDTTGDRVGLGFFSSQRNELSSVGDV